MASADATFVPRKGQAYRVLLTILNASGDPVSGATGLDSEISKDQGTFVDCTNEATEIATSSGFYYLDLTSTEMNADGIAVRVQTTSAGAKTTPIFLFPQETGDMHVTVDGFANGAITTASFTAGALTTTVFGSGFLTAGLIATDAIGAAELAADAATEIAAAVAAQIITDHGTGSYAGLQPANQGTLASVTNSTTVTLASSAVATGSYYNNCLLWLNGGTGGGQIRPITGYTSGRIVTVAPAFTTTPDGTTTYLVIPDYVGGAVSSIGTGGIVAASFAASAITTAAFAAGALTTSVFGNGFLTAGKIATDAIGAAQLATDAVAEIQSGLATATALAAVQADTDDMQTRLPAALVSGRMSSDAVAISGSTLAADEVEANIPSLDATVSSRSTFAGGQVASVLGNVGGDVVGQVLGSVVGDVQGNVQGNVGGSIAGGVTGNVGGVAAGGIAAASFAADTDIYTAKAWLVDDNAGTTDRWMVAWYKNGAPQLSGITNAQIRIFKETDGTDLVALTAMTQIGSEGVYKFDATGGSRVSDGAAYVAKLTADIGGSTRTWIQPIGVKS